MICASLDWLQPEGKIICANNVVSYLRDITDRGLTISIGSDSMLFSKYCVFSTAIAVHSNQLQIANYFYQKEKSFDSKFKQLEVKILKEVEYSIVIANAIKEKIFNANIEIHVDIGAEKRNATRHLVENSRGWIISSGYIFKMKPESWAASIADWHTK